MSAPTHLWCAHCRAPCGHDWRECWVHARLHGRLLGTDWACNAHEAEREAELRDHTSAMPLHVWA